MGDRKSVDAKMSGRGKGKKWEVCEKPGSRIMCQALRILNLKANSLFQDVERKWIDHHEV
jgi:hypothetical protein